MQKAIAIAKQISKEPLTNPMELLESVNLHAIFKPIVDTFPIKTASTLICYIIYAYDNHSAWIEINQDRWDNKTKILESLGADVSTELWKEVMEGDNDIVNDVVLVYLQEITTWEWITIQTNLDYHSKMLRYVSSPISPQKTKVTSTDAEGNNIVDESEVLPKEETISKINKDKADILKKATEARMEADALLAKIRTEYVKTDTATSSDFGFTITDEKRINIYSWRDYIRNTFIPMRERQKEERKKRLLA